MNHILLTREALELGAINELVVHDSCGAASFFVGTTRDNFNNKKVISLEYEAYEPMAIKEMENICTELRSRWSDLVNIAIYHRLGLVPVREASVIIAISSPHRQSALDSTALAIEELKRRVPIWKKEKYENDESSWKENKESDNTQPKKFPKLDFSACGVDDNIVPSSLVQIAAEENEIHRRIKCFVEKKREEIDLNNVMDFTFINEQRESSNTAVKSDHSTCARVNSIVVKQEHSKCHLRVRRVENRIGPQTRPNYLCALNKLMSNTTAVKIEHENKDALQERLTNIEDYLGIEIDSKHLHQRLKSIENRILHLESISPEYKHFLCSPTNDNKDLFNDSPTQFGNTISKKMCSEKINGINHSPVCYSINDLNAIIKHIENRRDSDESN